MAMMSVTFEVMFRVMADVEQDEIVCVVGDCDKLGNWDPHKAIRLNKESSPRKSSDNSDSVAQNSDGKHGITWRARVKLCGMKDYKYRYFVCKMKDSDSEESEKYVNVIRWETNIEPRVFSPAEYINNPNKYDAEVAVFGSYDNKSFITEGWLTDQSEIHFRLFDSPIHMWKPRYRKQTYSVKCTPLDHRYKDDNLDEDDEEWGSHTAPPTTFTNVLVSVLEKGLEVPAVQTHYGQIYREGSYLVFTCQTADPESLGFQFDFYVHEDGQTPRHVGYCFLLPFDLKRTNDLRKVPITGLKHRPIGQLILDYLIIRPIPGLQMSMEVSYQNYWKFERGSLDVGHRGMGSSYKHKKLAAVRENTVKSLQSAASHGADYVEFDVQLSKDLVPVIYHDFHVAITYRKKKKDELEYFKISVKDVSVEELQSMKLSHTSNMSDKDVAELHKDDLDPADLQPFPTLQQCFEGVDENVGFNVEVKYPQEVADGTFEDDNFMSRNKYIDIIVRCVFEFAGKRRVIFSSFDCDCCLLLRLKQNKYPVLFLTNGETDYYVPYADVRTKTIKQAISFAKFANLLGIDVFTKPLIQNLDLIEEVKKAGLVLFCWGEDNNNSNTINTLKQRGVDGIIYDRIDFYKSNKTSVFKMERAQKRQFLEQYGPRSLALPQVDLDATSGSEVGSDTNS